MWCYSGRHDRADEALAPARDFGNPLLVGLAPMPYSVLQAAFDALMPPGLQWYWKVDFFEQITDEAITIHRRYGESIPTPLSTMHMYPTTVRPPGCRRTPPPLHIATGAGYASRPESIPIPPIFRRQPVGHSSTGRNYTPARLVAAT
jgi:hypothetical protein